MKDIRPTDVLIFIALAAAGWVIHKAFDKLSVAGDALDSASDAFADWWVGPSELQLAAAFVLPDGRRIDPASPSVTRKWVGDTLYATYEGKRYRVMQRAGNGDFALVVA